MAELIRSFNVVVPLFPPAQLALVIARWNLATQFRNYPPLIWWSNFGLKVDKKKRGGGQIFCFLFLRVLDRTKKFSVRPAGPICCRDRPQIGGLEEKYLLRSCWCFGSNQKEKETGPFGTENLSRSWGLNRKGDWKLQTRGGLGRL
jgi:hypothetical protein